MQKQRLYLTANAARCARIEGRIDLLMKKDKAFYTLGQLCDLKTIFFLRELLLLLDR